MKKLIIYSLIFISNLSFSQSKIATTEDGKRVLLRDNNTWEYIDSTTNSQQATSENKCVFGKDFKEPKSKWSERLRKHVAIENDCDLKDVKILRITESYGNGMYSVCVRGNEMKYRMIGSAFLKAEDDPFPNKN